MTAFNRLRTSVIPAAVLLIAGVAAPTSHADPDDFYNDVSSLGITSSDGEEGVVQVGQAICSALERGMTREGVATQLFYNSAVAKGNNGITLEQAQQEVTFAVNDLCPP